MAGSERKNPWVSRCRAKQKTENKNGGALRLGFWGGEKTTEISLTHMLLTAHPHTTRTTRQVGQLVLTTQQPLRVTAAAAC